VQPCQDFAALEFSNPQIENKQAASFDNCGNTESENHECSPLCICSCRQISVAHKIPVLSSNTVIAGFTKSIVQISQPRNYFIIITALSGSRQNLISQSKRIFFV
jgi:hypothetical protein